MLIKKCIAETAGTFLMVLLGTGAATVNEVSGGAVTQMGISIAFGVGVLIAILALGHISGSHINPAVTIALAVYRHFPGKFVIPYIISQTVGALLASWVLNVCFPSSAFLGATLPAGSVLQSFLLELFLSFALMCTVLQVIKSLSNHKITGAVIIGSVVLLEAYFAGPICGASMNPARSLAPALVSGQFQHLWVYLIAPAIGMSIAGLVFNIKKILS